MTLEPSTIAALIAAGAVIFSGWWASRTSKQLKEVDGRSASLTSQLEGWANLVRQLRTEVHEYRNDVHELRLVIEECEADKHVLTLRVRQLELNGRKEQPE